MNFFQRSWLVACLVALVSGKVTTYFPCTPGDLCCQKAAPGSFATHPPCAVRVSISSAAKYSASVDALLLITDNVTAPFDGFASFAATQTTAQQNVIHIDACGSDSAEQLIKTQATIDWLFTPQYPILMLQGCSNPTFKKQDVTPIAFYTAETNMRNSAVVIMGWGSSAYVASAVTLSTPDVGRVLMNPVDIRRRNVLETFPSMLFASPVFMYQTYGGSCMDCFDTEWTDNCGVADDLWDDAVFEHAKTIYRVNDRYTGLLNSVSTNTCTPAPVQSTQMRFASHAINQFTRWIRQPSTPPTYRDCESVASSVLYNGLINCATGNV